MRRIGGVLGAWVICAGSALAQGQDLPAASCCQPALLDTQAVGQPSSCFYAEVDYLLRWFKPVCLTPPLLTIGSPTSAVPGALGQPGTQVVVGESHKFEF